eukprot:2600144-Amphidinium_carterae.1
MLPEGFLASFSILFGRPQSFLLQSEAASALGPNLQGARSSIIPELPRLLYVLSHKSRSPWVHCGPLTWNLSCACSTLAAGAFWTPRYCGSLKYDSISIATVIRLVAGDLLPA